MQRTARSSQPNSAPRAVRKPLALVYYHGRNDLDHTVTLSIRGQRYEYFLTAPQCNTVEFLCKQGLARRALNYAKSRARDVVKVRT